jgi:phage terminase large subunit GpA-like protein
MMHFRNNAQIVGAEEWRAIYKAPVPIAPSVWAVANLIVPDGPRAASAWDMSLTPYIAEPLDMLGPESPVNEIAAMKSAQDGFTLLLIALMGHTIDRNPCRVMIIQPTDAALSKFNREKLGPAIRASSVLRRKVASQTSRSAEGSTSYSKRFPGDR